MSRFLCFLLAVALSASASAQQPPAPAVPTPHKWAVAIHGGAGVLQRAAGMSPHVELAYRNGIKEALLAASAILDKGGSSLDAVEAAIKLLEDNPNFNAGRGAVFAADGTIQLDAAVMDGATLRAGAVADVQHTRHPISLARAVMEQSPHVMLIGSGADDFAASIHLEQVPQSFFFTERRWQQLATELTRQGLPIPTRPQGAPVPPVGGPSIGPHAPKPTAFSEMPDAHKFGTVGVVALDRQGNVAAGTSTGGIAGKRWNRVGDSPVIGAGTYASNQSCAVSATGAGEFFIRLTVARTICALVQYKGMSLQAAADEVIHKQLTALHGDGGVIALTPDGQVTWSYNTPGMFRGKVIEGGTSQVAIYDDEP